jgi:hypothetical protein
MKSECIIVDCNQFLREWDIRNIASDLRKNIYERHPNDAESVRLWVQANPAQVFFYQEFGDMKTALPRELNGKNMPFVIGIQNQFQFQMMLEYRHESAVSLDATFDTNQPKVRLPTYLEFPSLLACSHYGFLTHSRTTGDSLAVSPRKSLAQVQGPVWSLMPSHMIVLQFPLYTLMVFDKWQNGVPIAFIITKWNKQMDL